MTPSFSSLARNMPFIIWLVQVATVSIVVIGCLLFSVSLAELLGAGYMPAALRDALSNMINVRTTPTESLPGATD